MGVLKEINPDQVNMSFAGVLIDGFADGEFVRIEPNANLYETVVGTSGEVARSRNLDRSHLVTFVLLQTSDSNTGLSEVANRDASGPNGGGVGVLNIKDLNGQSLWVAEQAWVERWPDVSMDRQATSREWAIRCADLKRQDTGT